MRLPPKWLRRILIAPAVVVGVALALVSMPIWIIGALFVSRMVPGKWRIFRIAWFLFLYLVVEAAALVAMFGMWIGSGFGWKLETPRFVDAHYSLLGWVLRRVIRSALYTFKLTLVADGPRPARRGDGSQRRPILVLSRHAGPGDSMLLMNGLVNNYGRKPRIVLKEFLQWDPAVDVILNRLPAAVRPGRPQGW